MNRIRIKNPKTDKFICSDGEVVEFLNGVGCEVQWLDGEAYILNGRLRSKQGGLDDG